MPDEDETEEDVEDAHLLSPLLVDEAPHSNKSGNVQILAAKNATPANGGSAVSASANGCKEVTIQMTMATPPPVMRRHSGQVVGAAPAHKSKAITIDAKASQATFSANNHNNSKERRRHNKKKMVLGSSSSESSSSSNDNTENEDDYDEMVRFS